MVVGWARADKVIGREYPWTSPKGRSKFMGIGKDVLYNRLDVA